MKLTAANTIFKDNAEVNIALVWVLFTNFTIFRESQCTWSWLITTTAMFTVVPRWWLFNSSGWQVPNILIFGGNKLALASKYFCLWWDLLAGSKTSNTIKLWTHRMSFLLVSIRQQQLEWLSRAHNSAKAQQSNIIYNHYLDKTRCFSRGNHVQLLHHFSHQLWPDTCAAWLQWQTKLFCPKTGFSRTSTLLHITQDEEM